MHFKFNLAYVAYAISGSSTSFILKSRLLQVLQT